MDDELYDPKRFVADFPLWIIVAEGFNPDNEPFAPMVMNTAEMRSILLLFTDEDLANKYIEEHGEHGRLPYPIRDPKALRELLAGFETCGGRHVGID
jgi:hypothetical protein